MGGASRGARGARGRAGVGLSAQARVFPPRGVLGVSGLPRRGRSCGRARAGGGPWRFGLWTARAARGCSAGPGERGGIPPPSQAAPPPAGAVSTQNGGASGTPERTRRKGRVLGGGRACRGVSILVGAEGARPRPGGLSASCHRPGGRLGRTGTGCRALIAAHPSEPGAEALHL